jgi:hypothetical protein
MWRVRSRDLVWEDAFLRELCGGVWSTWFVVVAWVASEFIREVIKVRDVGSCEEAIFVSLWTYLST